MQATGSILAIDYSDSLSFYATGGGGDYEINVRTADNDQLK
jgi:hypothetical protein